MQVYLGEEGHEIMALVDTGSELNIIPEDSAIKAGLTTRCLNMNLRGIGGHCTSIVGLAEFTPITLVTGEERNIHLFVARGAVHTVLGRPFLADNNIRLDFSQPKGEIFSYIEPDVRRLCLPICSPQKVGWRENPPAGMETCAVSKLEDWKELPVEKEPSSYNQAISEEHPQIFKEEGMMKSEGKREIKVELASEDIKPEPKEINITGITTSKRENGNTCNQISQAINSDNFKNHEDIRRKPLTKLLSPIQELKFLSKGIFKNSWKSSIKPVATVINFTAEGRYLNYHPNKLALNSLKETSLKHKITIIKDLKHQDHSLVREESIRSTSKPKQPEELNKKLEYIMENQSKNGNYYEASLKKDNDEIQKLQLFPLNMVNIDPRLIMENKNIIKQNLIKSKIEIRKSEQELAKELTQEPNNESDTYLCKENNLFHIYTPNKDPIFLQHPQHFKAFHPSRELNKEIQPENKAIKQVVTEKKQSEITKNEDLINPRLKGPSNISIQAKEHEHKITHHYGHLPHPENYFGRENKNIKSNLVKRISKKSYKNERRRAKPYDRIAPNQKLSSSLPLHLAHRHLTSIQKENLLEYKKEENNYFSTQIGQNGFFIYINKEKLTCIEVNKAKQVSSFGTGKSQ
ncbi:hypothetical protein O181_110286 [Austropuccinia psidii MF-1]|uniref:Peptidase A2 domain-containing protein n=1 Tax=Austropuccinia psidii MF-1 TaxID=1389203 RepID=A0A9Q3JYB1_9BASI|nr:hypothetical protein [Austropuccinia psidii MF-1]